ncbi:YbjN domain-containing protein [Sphingomonas sp.]|uniref:YbjN domain-containing protein n=1 Tax=Sphingomonas sp. TaxID=28214 RepID=UPI001DF52C5E|nr:YbjN domain-containing protein [Sphingomonas sp.]MBX9795624.1 YbjN domain-containing protein [Sphingomonas sp.]
MIAIALMFASLCAPMRADAADPVLLDLSNAELVAAALRDAGYKAEIKTYPNGEKYIDSAVNGQGFSVNLDNCEAGKCVALQFTSWWKAEPLFTPALANEWNHNRRFLRVSLDKQGNLVEWLDFSVAGKLTKENFADVIDWYAAMDAELNKFLEEKRNAAKTGGAKK